MIKKFKNFDADEFLNKKASLKEDVNLDNGEQVEEPEKIEEEDIETDIPEDEVIFGTPIYKDKYLLKISHIVGRKLKAAGLDFGVGYNVVYLNDAPGVRFFERDGDRSIVCCRDTQNKSISVFNNFVVGEENTAIISYSTKKLGFKDMIDELISDLKGVSVNEGVINEAADRYGLGWTVKEVLAFEKLDHDERDFVYEFVRKYGKTTAASQFFSLADGGDPIALRVWKKYKGTDDVKGGPVRYMMDMANTVITAASGTKLGGSYQTAIDEHIIDNLVLDYKGAGPAIITSSEVTFDTGEEVDEFEKRRADLEARHQAELDEDQKKYEETMTSLQAVCEAMCNYVKQGGKLDKNDKSIMSRRGVLVTGKGGIGKTHAVKQALKNKNMAINRDYVWAGSGCSTADNVYKLMYDFNGKMLVFDDSPKLFEGDYRISMWKNALQTDLEDCLIGYPGKESKLTVYDVRDLKGDRQKKYFTEIGRKSLEDKSEFFKKQMKLKGIKYSSLKPGKVLPMASSELSDSEAEEVYRKIEDDWKEQESKTKPSMPNEFIFTGVVVIISNHSRAKFIEEVGKGNWDAISSRFNNYDISPLAETLWRVIKARIMGDYNDKTIDDENCVIPRDMVEEFIAEVEKLLSDPSGEYQSINWRTLVMFHDVLGGEPGRKTWKTELMKELARQ